MVILTEYNAVIMKRSICRPPYKKKGNRSLEDVTENMGSRFIPRMK